MNATSLLKSLRILAAVTLMTAALNAQSTVRFEAQPGSKVKIDGTSTVHDWTVEGLAIGGSFEVEDAWVGDIGKAPKVTPKVDVKIPVRSLKSGKKPMDNVMYDAMKQQQHPVIEYKLTEMVLREAATTPGGPCTYTTKGDLTVSGVKKAIVMPVKLERPEKDKLRFTGTTMLKMTDFGIAPPAPAIALGTIKTGDDVKISFEWVTAPKAP